MKSCCNTILLSLVLLLALGCATPTAFDKTKADILAEAVKKLSLEQGVRTKEEALLLVNDYLQFPLYVEELVLDSISEPFESGHWWVCKVRGKFSSFLGTFPLTTKEYQIRVHKLSGETWGPRGGIGRHVRYKDVDYRILEDKSGLYADVKKPGASENPSSTGEVSFFRNLCYEIADFIYRNLSDAIEPIEKDEIVVRQAELLSVIDIGGKRFVLVARIPLKYKADLHAQIDRR